MEDTNPNMSTIILNVNCLEKLIKRWRLLEWIKKHMYTRPNNMLLIRNFKYKDLDRLKVKGWKKIYHAKTNQKKSGATMLVSDKDLRTRKMIMD